MTFITMIFLFYYIFYFFVMEDVVDSIKVYIYCMINVRKMLTISINMIL